jgi:hypothetical protein
MGTLRFLSITILLLFLLAAPVFGQSATLVYADDLAEVEATDSAGSRVNVSFGATIPAGTTIETGATTVELTVEPSGTLIKIAGDTRFTLERIDVGTQTVDHSFRLGRGKIRTVVDSARGDRYRIRTPTAIAGVRGTDFAQRVVPGAVDWICVQEGVATFTRISDQERLTISARQFADVFADDFRAAAVGPLRLREIFSDVQFVEADPQG